MDQTVFLTDQSFPAGKAAFRARIGPTERGLKVLVIPFHGSAENCDFENAALL
jgi:hypothetical protein